MQTKGAHYDLKMSQLVIHVSHLNAHFIMENILLGLISRRVSLRFNLVFDGNIQITIVLCVGCAR